MAQTMRTQISVVAIIVFFAMAMIFPLLTSNESSIQSRHVIGTNIQQHDTCKVLFIGSSYFNYNDLPGLFKHLCKSAGKAVYIDHIGRNGMYLDDHVSSIETKQKIKEMDWDYVIIQGTGIYMAYPDYFTDHPEYPALETLWYMIHHHCASTKMVYCMPWAFEDGMTWYQNWIDTYADMQMKINETTLEYSRDIGFNIAPVGWVWYAVLEEKGYPLHYLHMSDWNHPSLKGSYLMSCVLFSTLFQQSSEDLSNVTGIALDEALYFQIIASEIVLTNLELWNIEEKPPIYVDDEGDGDYLSITEAANHSSAGDLIEVYSGTYYERNITLTQQGLTLRGIPYELGSGNDSGKPRIDAGSQNCNYMIAIRSVSNVTLTGFYFQNAGPISVNIIGVEGDGNLVSENIINSAGLCGIGIGSYARIFNNTIIQCNTAIGCLQGLFNCICGNVIHNCVGGVLLGCSNTTISGNTIYNCEWGISGDMVSDNVIERNWIYNCDMGLWFNGDNLVVERNRFSNCTKFGIGVKGTDSVIAYNLLEHNLVGVFVETFRSPVMVEKNNFIYNSIHATFWIAITSPGSLQFRENYWGRQHSLPEYLVGLICKWNEYGVPQLIWPFIKIDWNPAQEPYDIPG